MGGNRVHLSLQEAIVNISAPSSGSSINAVVTCGATIIFLRRSNNLYKACTVEDCNKKVTANEDGTYSCGKCGVVNPSFRWRFMLSLQIADSSGVLWVTSFQEASQAILGIDADT